MVYEISGKVTLGGNNIEGAKINAVYKDPDTYQVFIAIAHGTTPYFVLLTDSGGTLAKVGTYTLGGTGANQPRYNNAGTRIGVGTTYNSTGYFTLLDMGNDGTLTLAGSYAAINYWINNVSWNADDDKVACGGWETPKFSLLAIAENGTVTRTATYTLAGEAKGSSWNSDSTYIATVHNGGGHFTLLNQSAGSVTLASSYSLNFSDGDVGVEWSRTNDSYIACCGTAGSKFTLLGFNAGTVTLASSYALSQNGVQPRFNHDDSLIAVTMEVAPYLTILSNTAGTMAYVSTYTLAGYGEDCAWNDDSSKLVTYDRTGKVTLLTNSSGTLTLASTYTSAGGNGGGTDYGNATAVTGASHLLQTTTDGSGDYSFTSLSNVEHHISVQYTSGGTDYNAKSLPYVMPKSV
jgi:hypothetical protein